MGKETQISYRSRWPERKKEIEEKINPILQKKQYWKAKQILRSCIKNSKKYNPELFGLYGKVLSKMHDDMEAGKFFFLSNLRGPEYDDKIQLFIERYTNTRNKHYNSLSSQFPGIARYREIDDFPEPIRSDILKLGLITENRRGKRKTENVRRLPMVKRIKSSVFTVFLYILVITVLVSIPVGIITTWKWIINAIF